MDILELFVDEYLVEVDAIKSIDFCPSIDSISILEFSFFVFFGGIILRFIFSLLKFELD